MTDEPTSLSPKQPDSDEDPIRSLLFAGAASIACWVSWRLVPYLNHRPILMLWMVGVSLGVGGVVYCRQRAQPYFISRESAPRQSVFLRDSWRVLWTESYALDGRKWVRRAWISGVLAAVLWLATGVLSDAMH